MPSRLLVPKRTRHAQAGAPDEKTDEKIGGRIEAPRQRCPWAGAPDGQARSELMVRYHDEEWGVPIHDEHRLFEFMILEGAQAGLSWETVLRKRERYREVFAGFDPARVARFDKRKIEKLLADPGIIRNRLKIHSTISNAQSFLAVQEEFQSFDAYVWQFTGGAPKQNAWRGFKSVPCRSAESDALSKDLIQRGFRFVGSTICYSFMQATGMVNDHVQECFRHTELQ
jgi:DNA-3-methyladenine glycosylase I